MSNWTNERLKNGGEEGCGEYIVTILSIILELEMGKHYDAELMFCDKNTLRYGLQEKLTAQGKRDNYSLKDIQVTDPKDKTSADFIRIQRIY